MQTHTDGSVPLLLQPSALHLLDKHTLYAALSFLQPLSITFISEAPDTRVSASFASAFYTDSTYRLYITRLCVLYLPSLLLSRRRSTVAKRRCLPTQCRPGLWAGRVAIAFASSLSQGRTLLQPLNLLDFLSTFFSPVIAPSFSPESAGNSQDFRIV